MSGKRKTRSFSSATAYSSSDQSPNKSMRKENLMSPATSPAVKEKQTSYADAAPSTADGNDSDGEESVSVFVGDPVPDEEARRRRPQRYQDECLGSCSSTRSAIEGSCSSHVGLAGPAFKPQGDTVDPDTGRIWIRPVGKTELEPRKETKAFIENIMFKDFNQPWGSWKAVPKDTRGYWLKEFLDTFRWLPSHRNNLVAAWGHKASKCFAERMYKLREKKGRCDWCDPEMQKRLLELFKEDAKFQKKSEQNKKNRSQFVGPSHVGGSIPFSEHRKKIAARGDVPPESLDFATFERTHSHEGEAGKQWINPKSGEVAETYQKLLQERAMQAADGASSSHFDNDLFLQAAGGFDKKGRVFGLGGFASQYRSSQRASSQLHDEMHKMEQLVTSLTVESQEIKSQLQAQIEVQSQQLFAQQQKMDEMQALLTQLMKEKDKKKKNPDPEPPVSW